MTLATAPPASKVWLASLQTAALYHGFFTLKDSAGVRWYYHFLRDGSIEPLAEPPVYGIDVTADPSQTHIIFEDEASHVWYVTPDPGSGILEVVFDAPTGTAWNAVALGNEVIMFAARGSVYYNLHIAGIGQPVIEVSSATGPGLEGTITQQALLRLSGGSIAPVFDDLWWDPVLIHPGTYTTSVVGNPELVIDSQAGIPRYGTVELANSDATHDTTLRSLCAAGHEILTYQGTDADDFADMTLRYRSVLKSIEYDLDIARFVVVDKYRGLNIPIQQTLYLGTGGLEGSEDLEGKPKPIAYGHPFNVTPILIDVNGQSPIYQVHDGAVASITAYDSAIVLTNVGDVGVFGLASIYDWAPIAGSYVTDHERGLFRLGVGSTGILTVDVATDLNLLVSVLRDIVTTRGGLQDPGDLDTEKLDLLEAQRNWGIGLYIPHGDTVRIPDVLNALCRSAVAMWAFTPTGQFTARIFGPGGAFLDPVTIEDAHVLALRKLPSPSVYWRISVGYQRVYTVQPLHELETLAPSARKAFVNKEYRNVVGSTPGVLTDCPDAEELEWPTLLIDRVDAQLVLSLLRLRVGVQRHLYEIELRGHQFLHEIGDQPALDMSRYELVGLSNSTPQILELTEDLLEETTRVILWG